VEAETPVQRERLFGCGAFRLWHLHGEAPFAVVAEGVPRILICTEGTGQIEHDSVTYPVRKGEVRLLPAVVGACTFGPDSEVNLFEVAIPDNCKQTEARCFAKPNLLFNVAKVQGWMADEKAYYF
jgi:mannose-6-phosphate isomerase